MPPSSTPPLELVARAIELNWRAARGALANALEQVRAASADVSVRFDPEAGLVLLSGPDEASLEAFIADLLQDRALAVLLDVGAPRPVYRETLGRRVEVEHASGPVRLKLLFDPAPRGSGFRFESHAIGRGQPPGMVPGVEAGLNAARAKGLLAGFPVTDFRAALISGQAASAADEAAFAGAAQEAFGKLGEAGEPILLEPVMGLEVTSDEGVDSARLASDLEACGGRILAEFVEGEKRTLTAVAPLAGLFGYAARLEAMTAGHARAVMRFKGYEPVSIAIPRDEREDEAPEPDFGWSRLLAAVPAGSPAQPANDS